MPRSHPLRCQPFVHRIVASCLVGAWLLSAGCGLKAPLYLPEDKKQQVSPDESDKDESKTKRRIPRPPPAPQATKQDRIDNESRSGGSAPGTTSDPSGPATPPPPSGD